MTVDSISAVGSALYSRLGTVQYTYNNGGTVPVTGTLGTYDTLAPQNPTTNPPYVIFQLMADVGEYTFGTANGQSMDWLIKVVSNRLYPSQQAYSLYNQAHGNVQNAPLSVTGYTVQRCRRQTQIAPFREANGYWHVGGIYRVDIWQS